MSELSVGTLSGLAANSYVIDVASGSQLTQPGMVLQVVSVAKTDAFTTSSTSFVDVTGLSASITPSSATSKIMVFVSTNSASRLDVVTNTMLRVMRDSTPIFIGDSAGSRIQVGFVGNSLGTDQHQATGAVVMNFLDSPATTSSVTYGVEIRSTQAQPVYVNRSYLDTDNTNNARSASSITLMEVAG